MRKVRVSRTHGRLCDAMTSNRTITAGQPDHDYVTVQEAAALLMVSPSTIWRWIGAGALPAYRFGRRRVRVKRIDLNRMIEPAHTRQRPRANERDHVDVAALELADPEDIWNGYDPAAVRRA